MTEEIDYTEVRDERIRGVIDGLLTDMLDDLLDFSSIDRFKWKMETFVLAEIAGTAGAVHRHFTGTKPPKQEALETIVMETMVEVVELWDPTADWDDAYIEQAKDIGKGLLRKLARLGFLSGKAKTMKDVVFCQQCNRPIRRPDERPEKMCRCGESF